MNIIHVHTVYYIVVDVCCCSKIKVVCMYKLCCIVKLHHERFNFARWVVIFHHTVYHKALVCTIFTYLTGRFLRVLVIIYSLFYVIRHIYSLNIPFLSFYVQGYSLSIVSALVLYFSFCFHHWTLGKDGMARKCMYIKHADYQ